MIFFLGRPEIVYCKVVLDRVNNYSLERRDGVSIILCSFVYIDIINQNILLLEKYFWFTYFRILYLYKI